MLELFKFVGQAFRKVLVACDRVLLEELSRAEGVLAFVNLEAGPSDSGESGSGASWEEDSSPIETLDGTSL